MIDDTSSGTKKTTDFILLHIICLQNGYPIPQLERKIFEPESVYSSSGRKSHLSTETSLGPDKLALPFFFHLIHQFR